MRTLQLTSMLVLLVAGCGDDMDVGPWGPLCTAFTDCGGPPFERTYETVTLPYPTGSPYRPEPAPKKTHDYRSEECDGKCAERKAERVKEMREAARDYEERLYRDWIPADDPRRWQ